MFQTFRGNDQTLHQERFMTDEAAYNLLHRIGGAASSTCLKTSDDTLIYAQSAGQNAWLWIAKDIAEEEKDKLMKELIAFVKGSALPGISGEPVTTARFAQLYAEANELRYRVNMTMESYVCANVKKPLRISGTMHPAARSNVDTVAEFLAGFSEGAYGITVEPVSQLAEAERIIESGGLYLWFVDGQPVSMANIAHRSPRHARINAVYTPAACRKKGYASTLVAELSSLLLAEGLLPMLYADLLNPDSNKVYRNVGFVESGKIVDMKFEQLES